MMKINGELKKVVGRIKAAQDRLQDALKNTSWVDDARKYAERQSKEVKKLFSADLSKVKTFVERERKELEKLQKQIPTEVKKWKKYVASQRKELEKALKGARKGARTTGTGRTNGTGTKSQKTSAKKRTTKKSAAAST